MSAAGWYPDPGGQPGMFRYWTGTAWTAAVTSDPSGAPPPGGSPFGGGQASGHGASGFIPSGGTSSFVSSSYPAASGAYPASASNDRPKRSATGWIIGLAALIVAVVVVVAFVIPRLGGGIAGPGLPGPGNSTPDMCAAASTGASPVPVPIGRDPDRVYGGAMSYQKLGLPWSDVEVPSNPVPFSSVSYMQTVLDHEGFSDNPAQTWVSSVIISELAVGDGFGSTQQGAEAVFKCVLGLFYSDTPVESKLVTSEAHSVDGHDGWLLVSDLSFSIPNLPVTGERAIILVVATDPVNQLYSLFYASVPDDQTELLPDAEAAMASLTVDE